MRKGQIDLSTLIMFVVVFIIYVTALYPVIQPYIESVVNNDTYDPLTQSAVMFLPFFFILAIMIGLYHYAFGRRPTAIT